MLIAKQGERNVKPNSDLLSIKRSPPTPNPPWSQWSTRLGHCSWSPVTTYIETTNNGQDVSIRIISGPGLDKRKSAEISLLCKNMLISSGSVFMVEACKKEVMMGKQLVNNALLHSPEHRVKMEEAGGSIKRGDWHQLGPHSIYFTFANGPHQGADPLIMTGTLHMNCWDKNCS